MRTWETASGFGRCAYCGKPFAAGSRIYRIQGAGWKAKDYDADCAKSRQEAGEDTGDVVTEVAVFAPLKALAEQAGARFDSRMAAAGDRD